MGHFFVLVLFFRRLFWLVFGIFFVVVLGFGFFWVFLFCWFFGVVCLCFGLFFGFDFFVLFWSGRGCCLSILQDERVAENLVVIME